MDFLSNAKIILAESRDPMKLSNYNFNWQLRKSLVLQEVQCRQYDCKGKKSDVMQKMKKVLRISDPKRLLVAVKSSKEDRCHVCERIIVGTPDYMNAQKKI